MVESLLAAGADANLHYGDDYDERITALHAAVSNGNEAVVKLLLIEAGAEVNFPVSELG